MKKYNVFILITIISLFVRCKPEPDIDDTQNQKLTEVTVEMEIPKNRILMGKYGRLAWDEDDFLYIFMGEDAKPYKLNIVEDDEAAQSSLRRFKGLMVSDSSCLETDVYHTGITEILARGISKNLYQQIGVIDRCFLAKARTLFYDTGTSYCAVGKPKMTMISSVMYIDFTGLDSELYIDFEGCSNFITVVKTDEYLKKYSEDTTKIVRVIESELKYTKGRLLYSGECTKTYVVLFPQQEPIPNTVMKIMNYDKEVIGTILFPNGITSNKLYLGKGGDAIKISARSPAEIEEKDLT